MGKKETKRLVAMGGQPTCNLCNKPIEDVVEPLFAHEADGLLKALDEVFRYPLQEAAKNTLNRQLRSNIDDEQLATLVVGLYEEGRLCLVQELQEAGEPQIICSLGLVA